VNNNTSQFPVFSKWLSANEQSHTLIKALYPESIKEIKDQKIDIFCTNPDL